MNAKDLKAAKQELEQIKSLQDDITKNSARYNKEGILGVKAHKELIKLRKSELSLAITAYLIFFFCIFRAPPLLPHERPGVGASFVSEGGDGLTYSLG